MKNIIKITTGILLTFIMIVTSMINVNAAQNTISIGGATKINNAHINNLTFSYKVTTDGRYLYCLNRHKSTASNVQANLVSNSSLVDGGVLYILKNGYPERSITGDREKDYYITQTAVWSYLDQTHGTNNLNGIKLFFTCHNPPQKLIGEERPAERDACRYLLAGKSVGEAGGAVVGSDALHVCGPFLSGNSCIR